MSHGLFLTTNYEIAHALDNAPYDGGANGAVPQNPLNRAADYGNYDNDIRSRLNLYLLRRGLHWEASESYYFVSSAFKVFNHPQFAIPASTINASGQGRSERHLTPPGSCKERLASHSEVNIERIGQMVHATQRRRPIAAFAAMQSRQMAGAGEHSIAKVLAYAVRPASTKGEGYSVLQIETKSGVTGYGECGPISAADVKALSSILVGKSAFAYEPLSEMAPRPTRGGVNMALLDIAGKVTKAPVYRVLGGPTRTKARAVARLQGSTDAEIISEAKNHATAGVRAFLVPIEPPSARNQGSLFIKTNLDRLDALRAAIPKSDFAIAGASQLTPSDAASLASAAEKDRPLWFDQPCDITNLDALRKVCDETVVPVAFGRGIGNPGVFQDLLRRGLIDLVRPDLLVYGISGACRLAAMAETYYVAVAPLHDAGPIATAAALQAAASMPNFFALEVPASGMGSLKVKDGFFELPKDPGLGINVDGSKFERSRIA